jgi:hypothetical protein
MKKALFCVLTILVAAISYSQQIGTLKGFVVNQDNRPVLNAKIQINDIDETLTDTKGNFDIPSFPYGQHRLKITADGYIAIEQCFELTNTEFRQQYQLIKKLPNSSFLEKITLKNEIKTDKYKKVYLCLNFYSKERMENNLEIPPNTTCELIHWYKEGLFKLFSSNYKNTYEEKYSECYPFYYGLGNNKLGDSGSNSWLKVRVFGSTGFIHYADISTNDKMYFDSLLNSVPLPEVSINYPKTVSLKNGKYQWVTDFKETGGVCGIELEKIDCYIEGENSAGEKGRWVGCNGGKVILEPKGTASDSYWCSTNGTYHAVWEGIDAFGRRVKINQIIELE